MSAPHIISLGAGVQSSAMALMAAKGELGPMPIAAVFADTQAEPAGVYKWLDWLEGQLPFPVYRVRATQKSIEESETEIRQSKLSGKMYRRAMIPAFLDNGGMLRRKCTSDYKITPVLRKARELGNVPRRGRDGVYVVQWLGISTDEALRMKTSRHGWIENRWPLIESGISRNGCLKWMREKGYPQPPRSAYVFCPYHNDQEWVRLKTEEPAEFARAVEFEAKMREAAKRDETLEGSPFLHRSCRPLGEVEFKPKTPDGQIDMFNNECEGMCGV